MPDLSEYMTVSEFADLPGSQQIAVWQAHARNLVDAVPVQPSRTGGTFRYHRAQALAAIGEGVPR